MAHESVKLPVDVVDAASGVRLSAGDLRRELAAANAPILLFDDVPNSGVYNGIFHITLSAGRFQILDGKGVTDSLPVAYLRTNAQGLVALKEAIANAELLAKPAATDQQN